MSPLQGTITGNVKLLERAAGGDEDALQELFRLHLPLMRKIALVEERIPESAAEDIFQRVYVDFHRAARRIDHPTGYFATATRSLCREHFRRQERERRAMEQLALLESPRRDGRRFEERLISRIDVDAVLRRIEARCASLLKTIVLGEVPHSDYARESGMPLGSVGPTMLRCLEKMRRVAFASARKGRRP